MALKKELLLIIRRFENAAIPAIPLKGPILPQLLYGDIVLRLSLDLDILVPIEQMDAAKRLLIDNRFEYIMEPVEKRGA